MTRSGMEGVPLERRVRRLAITETGMELEQDYRSERGSGNETETAYTVEARYNYANPVQIGGQIFDNRWREVKFQDAVIGVPRCATFRRHTLEHGMLGYAAAQALRWWLHAAAEADNMSGLCLETRIVSHRISYSHKIETVAAHDHIHGEDRSNCVPDWGKTPNAKGQRMRRKRRPAAPTGCASNGNYGEENDGR